MYLFVLCPSQRREGEVRKSDLLIFAWANPGMLHLPVESTLAVTHRRQIQTTRGDEALAWIINCFDDGRRILTFKDGMLSGYGADISLDLARWWCWPTNSMGRKSRHEPAPANYRRLSRR
jgi:hypothetical protein